MNHLKTFLLKKRKELLDQDFIIKSLGTLGVLALMPFSIFHFISGGYLNFILVSSAILVMLADIYHIHVYQKSFFSNNPAIIAIGTLLWGVIYFNGSFAIYWAYPYIVLSLFILRSKTSAIIILLFIAAITPLIFQYIETASATRIVVTLTITAIFIYTFSHIVELQRQSLAESEKKYKTLIDTSLQGILIAADKGKPVFTNMAMANMLGYDSPDELTRLDSLQSLYHPEESARLIGYTQARLENKSAPAEYESRWQKKNGETTWLFTSAMSLDWEGERVEHAVYLDITKRKQAEEALYQSEELYRNLIETTSAVAWEVDAISLKFTYIGPQVKHITGYSPEEWTDFDFWKDHIYEEDRERSASYCQQKTSAREHHSFEYRMISASGKIIWIRDIVSVIMEDGQVVKLRGYFIDITESKKAEEKLRQFSRAVESSSSGIIITSNKSVIEYINPKMVEITGYSKDEMIGQNLQTLSAKDTPDWVFPDMWKTITSGSEWKGELHNQKKDGSLYWAHNSISGIINPNGEISHFICIQDDITHEYELSEQLSYLASHDILTGLVNRYDFESRIERLLSSMHNATDEHALFFMDLDQFKIVNDTCGHAAGDKMLHQLSRVLKIEIRKRDTLARLGGDEFGVLMEHCTLDQAFKVAQNLLKCVKSYELSWEGHQFRVGISIGLVPITKTTLNLAELLKNADAACYIAKAQGKNRIHIHHQDKWDKTIEHDEVKWVNRINHAFMNNLFCLYAQPIFSLADSNEKHYELLIRMKEENGEVILPGVFFPAAQHFDLMRKIDLWVLEKAFSLVVANPGMLNLIDSISINLSESSLTSTDFLDKITLEFEKTGINPAKICFEISETTAISNLDETINFIKKIKNIGCHFALDDFGSGLSSFGYLKNLHVDYLKIDGIYVKNMIEDSIDLAMVKSIHAIGHVIGMKTIAEFVESQEINDRLKSIGVNYAQGYALSKPIPFEEIPELTMSNAELDL